MSAKARLTSDQAQMIRDSSLTATELSKLYGVSAVTISKIRNYKGAYRNTVLALGVPVLDSHGAVVGVTEGAKLDAQADPLRIPAAHSPKDGETN